MEINGRNHTASKGVALLMSMTVVLLLSIALMKTFEKRSLEVVQLGHNLDRFQADNLTRSGLKLILYSIRRAGMVTINAYLEQLKQIAFPIGSGTMKILEIRPADHRFNLNKKISQATDPRVAVFRNMVSFSKTSSNDYNYLSAENTNEALSAIIDWTDRDDTRDDVFLYDSESYPREEPEFRVKNREFDRLSEVRLLPAFRKLGFKRDFLEANFRATDSSDPVEFVDVNLTPIADIDRFLHFYDGVDGYPSVSARREEILRIITSARSTISPTVGTSGFAAVEMPFPVNNFGRLWHDRLKIEGINLETKEEGLFRPLSNYLFLHYQVTVGRATLNARAMVHVEYVKEKSDIKAITIIWFRID